MDAAADAPTYRSPRATGLMACALSTVELTESVIAAKRAVRITQNTLDARPYPPFLLVCGDRRHRPHKRLEKRHKVRDNNASITSFIGMPQMMQGAPGAQKSTWFQHISKGVALIASTGAALISIITALFSYGVIGSSESHQSIGNLGAAWVKLRPAI